MYIQRNVPSCSYEANRLLDEFFKAEPCDRLAVIFDADMDYVQEALHYLSEFKTSKRFEPFREAVYEFYASQFKEWDWQGFKREAEINDGYCFIGTVFALLPSGKYYTAWANSNVYDDEALLDEIWYEALGEVAEEKGFSVTSGGGDPCDLYLFHVDYVSDAEGEEDESFQ